MSGWFDCGNLSVRKPAPSPIAPLEAPVTHWRIIVCVQCLRFTCGRTPRRAFSFARRVPQKGSRPTSLLSFRAWSPAFCFRQLVSLPCQSLYLHLLYVPVFAGAWTSHFPCGSHFDCRLIANVGQASSARKRTYRRECNHARQAWADASPA